MVWFETQFQAISFGVEKATNHEESQLSQQPLPSLGEGRPRSHNSHGFYTTRRSKRRRRYQCQTCGKTFSSTTGTAYYRLQHPRATFDEVASLSIEGLNESAIARVKRSAWNTVHRWLDRAGVWCRCFNDRKIEGLSVAELQADEIKTIVGSKKEPIWIFAVIEVWSRLWPSRVVGKRSNENTLSVFRNLSRRMNLEPFLWLSRMDSGFTRKSSDESWGRGDQDSRKRLHREGGAKSGAWRQVAIGTAAAGLQTLSKTQDVIRRAIESHDPTSLARRTMSYSCSSHQVSVARR
jgi:transposase-like protein